MKKLKLLIIPLFLILFVGCLYGCGGKQHYIRFNTHGGSIESQLPVIVGEEVVLPDDPTLYGHNFAGWYLDEEYTEEFNVRYFMDDSKDANYPEVLYLHAKWEPKELTVTLNYGYDDLNEKVNTIYGEKYFDSEYTLFRTGYVFKGWYTGKNGSGTLITSGAKGIKITKESNHTLYAYWTPENGVVVLDSYIVGLKKFNDTLATEPYDRNTKPRWFNFSTMGEEYTFKYVFAKLADVEMGYDQLGVYLDSSGYFAIANELYVKATHDYVYNTCKYSVYSKDSQTGVYTVVKSATAMSSQTYEYDANADGTAETIKYYQFNYNGITYSYCPEELYLVNSDETLTVVNKGTDGYFLYDGENASFQMQCSTEITSGIQTVNVTESTDSYSFTLNGTKYVVKLNSSTSVMTIGSIQYPLDDEGYFKLGTSGYYIRFNADKSSAVCMRRGNVLIFNQTVVAADDSEYAYGGIADTLESSLITTDFSKRYDYGTTITTLPTPVPPTGMTFAGWYSLGDNEKQYINGESTFDAQAALYLVAKFVPQQATLTLVNTESDAEYYKKLNYTIGNEIAISELNSLIRPTKEGKIFKGWSLVEDGTTWLTNSFVITKDTTLYSVWIDKDSLNNYYYYIYDGSNNLYRSRNAEMTAGSAPNFISLTISAGQYGFAYNGIFYTFNADKTELTKTGDNPVVKTSILPTQKVFAFEDVTFVYDGLFIIVAPTKEGYTFKGFSTQIGITNVQAYDFTRTPTQDINLYSNFVANEYIVNYYSDFESEEPFRTVTSTVANWQSKTPSKPIRAGYTFTGWYYLDGENPIRITTNLLDSLNADGEVDIYANWIEEDSHTKTINFYVDGTLASSKEIAYGDEIGNLPKPTKEGYYFLGWFYEDSTHEYEVKSDLEWTINANQTLEEYTMINSVFGGETIELHARFIIRVYPVLIRFNNGSITSYVWSSSAVMAGNFIQLNLEPYEDVKYNGYTLVGFNTKADGSGTSYRDGDYIEITSVTVLFLEWQAKPIQVVFKDPQTGALIEGIDQKTIYFGDKIGNLQYPTSSDGTQGFAGWGIRSLVSENRYIIVNETYKIKEYASEIVLYQLWSDENFYVRYMTVLDDGEVESIGTSWIQTAEQGVDTKLDLTIFNKTPTRTGYIFLGWYGYDSLTQAYSTNPYDSTTTIDRDLYIYAKWQRVTTVQLSLEYDTLITLDNVQLKEGEEISTLPIPSRTGYSFQGWFSERNGAGTEISNGDVWTLYFTKLYAYWIAE